MPKTPHIGELRALPCHGLPLLASGVRRPAGRRAGRVGFGAPLRNRDCVLGPRPQILDYPRGAQMGALDELLASWRSNPDADSTVALCAYLGATGQEALVREVGSTAQTWHGQDAV